MEGPRQRASSGSPWELVVGYSRAVRVGRHVAIAGTAPQWPDGHVDESVEAQTRRCLDIIATALGELGSSVSDVVRTRIYLVDADDFSVVGQVHGEVFGSVQPANTTVVVAGLLDPRWRVEIEAEAILPPSSVRQP